MNIAVELLIIISALCSDGVPARNKAEIDKINNCSTQIISCVETTVRRQFIKDQVKAFNQCYLVYEQTK